MSSVVHFMQPQHLVARLSRQYIGKALIREPCNCLFQVLEIQDTRQ